VPTEGVEPTLPCGNRILSPARLPVPPRRLGRKGISNRREEKRKRSVFAGAVKKKRTEGRSAAVRDHKLLSYRRVGVWAYRRMGVSADGRIGVKTPGRSVELEAQPTVKLEASLRNAIRFFRVPGNFTRGERMCMDSWGPGL
jgi:hypothetical protein